MVGRGDVLAALVDQPHDGEPIPTDGYPPEAAEDPMLMFNLTDQVREQIQHTLYKLLVQRRSVFF